MDNPIPALRDRNDGPARAAMGETNNALRDLIDRLPDEVYAKDCQSRFVFVNEATVLFLGAASRENVLGKTDFDFFPPELASQFMAEEQALLQRDQPCVNREAPITDSSGRKRWVLTTKVPLRDPAGNITGLLGINRDITERKQAQQAIQRMNAELEQRVAERTSRLQETNQSLQEEVARRRQTEEELLAAMKRLEEVDRTRSEFVFNVSHELKTPLTSMTYGIRNLLEGIAGPLPDRAMKYLRMLNEDCRRLSATIADILDLGRLETKTMRLNKTCLFLERLVGRVAAGLSVQATDRQIKVNVRTEPGTGFVDCDAFKLERAIGNILHNAIRFSPPGETVALTVRRETASPATVTVEITDKGIGIPAQHLGRISERFYRVGEHVTGTGLGLSIAREIVELHGGRLEIRSPPPGLDQGTQVSIHLPAAEAPLILVADDDEAVRFLMELQLKNRGYRVLSCASGTEALEAARQHRPLVAILDIYMPELNGIGAILRLKADQDLRQIPTLVVTGGLLDRGQQEVLQGYGIAPLSKPWAEEELLGRIETALIGVSLSAIQQPGDQEAS